MTAPSQHPDAADLARLKQESLRKRFGQFPTRVLTWLGALPAWTVTLGTSLGLGETPALTEIVDRLKAANLVESRHILQPDGEPTDAFWLRSSVRPELGSYLQGTTGSQLDRELGALADAVAEQPTPSTTAGSVGSADWLRIVRVYLPDRSGQALIAEVDALLKRGGLAAATTLVTAAGGIGELASSSLLDATRRARWRIDGAIRTEQDLGRLVHYSHRQPIEKAIEDLLTGGDSTWALHLLGDGGIGKTMLIRYLASGRFSADHDLAGEFCVTRVDFDRLDASYPQQRPAELLLALATELEPFVTSRELDRRYRAFQDAAILLHERQAGVEADDDDSDLQGAVTQFASFLEGLPARVLLVLDTCEELAKLYTSQTVAPAINETFRLLELIHSQVPATRVLLAGRRWLVPATDRLRRAAGPLLDPRPYLRVLEVTGFTKAEADYYLDGRQTEWLADQRATPLSPDLRETLLRRCELPRVQGQPMFSPFELAAYCDWVAEDPDLDPGRLRSADGDPYVEWRIIGHLGDDQVRSALGVAAELGQFDFTLVAPALLRAGLDPVHVFDALAAQEWVNVRSLRADGRPAVIEVDEHLRERIRRVTARDPRQFPVDRAELGRDARRVIMNTELAAIPAEIVVAAVELLPPDDAAGLWRQIEEKIASEGAWGWADQVAVRVRAAEQTRLGESAPDAGTIMAALIASQASARLHDRPGPDVLWLWRDAERVANRYPAGPDRETLLQRIRLGRLAAGDLADKSLLAGVLLAAAKAPTPLTGGIIAAIRGCVSRGEDLPEPVPTLIEELAASTNDLDVKAAAQLAASVLKLWADQPDEAARLAQAASECAVQAASHPGRPWADWAVPHRLADQCRLIRLHIAWRRGEPIDAVPWEEWRMAALEHIFDIDAERLVAATVKFELGHRVIDADELEAIGRAERYSPGRRPSAWVHGQVPPLLVELARAWQVLGQPDRCARMLRERLELAVSGGEDPDTIDRCQLALLWLCRRERTTRWLYSVNQLSQEGPPRQRQEAWLVRTLVDGEHPRDPVAAGSWSTWWQCQDLGLEPDEISLPIDATLADRAELAARWPRHFPPSRNKAGPTWADPPALPASLTGPHDFDPAYEIRLGHELSLPPGDLGRAAVAAAELTALRLPRQEWPKLLDAGLALLSAGDEAGCYEAVLLARLAAVRAGAGVAAEDSSWPLDLTGERARTILGDRPGWLDRLEVVTAYLAGRAGPESLPPSPEYRPLLRRSRLRRLASVLGNLSGGLTVSGGALVTAAVSVGLGEIDVVAVVALIAAGLGFRVALEFVPYKFTASRAIEVSKLPDGAVTARAVTSRGMRDLTGLTFSALTGALAGLWSLGSLFFPWRGTWTQSVPAGLSPAFDLDGLKLPPRPGLRHLTTIRLVIDDPGVQQLPWEQWLGASQPTGQSTLVFYRQAAGAPVSMSFRSWRQATPVFRGPRHLVPEAVEPAELTALRLLYFVTTPVPTHAGWRLRVTDETRRGLGIVTRGKQVDEALLSIDEFPLRRTALVVLQAIPVDADPEPLGDLRSSFIGCAQDLLAAGAGSVLIIPPLPDDVAAQAVGIVWRAIAVKRTSPSPMTLLRTTAKLKNLISEASRQPAGTETAVLDVLLFLKTREEPSDSLGD